MPGLDLAAGTELDLASIERLARDLPRLMTLMLTGGEPFVRKDLPDIVGLFLRHTAVGAVSVVTSGFDPAAVAAAAERMLEADPSPRSLTVTISIDGPPRLHDRLRGREGAHANAMQTARLLRGLADKHPCLRVAANLTLFDENEEVLPATARDLRETGLFHHLSLNLYRENRPATVYVPKRAGAYADLAQLVADRGKGGTLADRWMRRKEARQAAVIRRMIEGGKGAGLACEAGRNIGVVYPDGSVAPCEALPPDWGSILEQGFGAIWNLPANRRRADALRRKGCYCTHECFLSVCLNTQVRPFLSCWSKTTC